SLKIVEKQSMLIKQIQSETKEINKKLIKIEKNTTASKPQTKNTTASKPQTKNTNSKTVANKKPDNKKKKTK
ncbi:MAG TPA: hypothetical protein VGC75_04565, partial [Candidatus Nitrosocosmicus sp.]